MDPDQPATAPPEDPGHLLPGEDWARVVREAERERQRIERGEPPPDPAARALAGRYATGLNLPTSGTVVARSHGGRRPRGWPSFGVLHSAETPLRAGYAAAIARYLAGSAVSAHYMVDPAETWGVLPDELIAWHCGNANPNSLGLEQAGYARYSRAEWLSPDGRAQLARVAAVLRAARERYGIGLYWMTDAQLLAAHHGSMGGWATHDQCRRVIGGTVHTDPGAGYPAAELMALANQEDEPEQPAADEGDDVAASRLIRNAKGTVVELAPTYAEWVPTAADHRAAIAQLGAHQTYSDDFFGRLITRARAAGTPPSGPVATRMTAALVAMGVDPEDPATWPATPETDE